MLAFVLALAIDEPAVTAIAAPPPHLYLKGAEARRPCGEAAASGEIVVCGRTDESDRLRSPDDDRQAQASGEAEVKFADGLKLRTGLQKNALTAGQQKTQPDEKPVKYGRTPTITVTIPLP